MLLGAICRANKGAARRRLHARLHAALVSTANASRLVGTKRPTPAAQTKKADAKRIMGKKKGTTMSLAEFTGDAPQQRDEPPTAPR